MTDNITSREATTYAEGSLQTKERILKLISTLGGEVNPDQLNDFDIQRALAEKLNQAVTANRHDDVRQIIEILSTVPISELRSSLQTQQSVKPLFEGQASKVAASN